MLKTKVKVSSIENLSDARFCAGMGVDLLGFPMPKIPLDKFNEIRNWLAGVTIVGEAHHCTVDEIIMFCNLYKPDYLEVDAQVNLTHLADIEIPKILLVNVDQDNLPALFTASMPFIRYFLLVGDSSDSLLGMESQIETWAAHYPILLGLSIPENELDAWVDQSSIQGIGILAGNEERPGFRDFTDLMTILEKLETE